MSTSSKPSSVRSRSTSTTLQGELNSTPVAATASVGRFIRPDTAELTLQDIRHTRTDSNLIATPNGTATAPPNRASPVPNQAQPNGKPTSPLVSTSNTHGSNMAPQTVTSKDPKAAAQAATDMKNIVRRKLTGYVGFANLPNQWHRKSVRKGFNFNVMVVGKH